MIKKRTLNLLSILSIVALSTVGFSSFYIDFSTPLYAYSNIETSIGDIIRGDVISIENEMNDLVFCDEGFVENIEVDNTVKSVITDRPVLKMSINLAYLEIRNTSDSINNVYIDFNLSQTHSDASDYDLISNFFTLNSLKIQSFIKEGSSTSLPSINVTNSINSYVYSSRVGISNLNDKIDILTISLTYTLNASSYTSEAYNTLTGKEISLTNSIEVFYD